jgi:hypothetical protein
MRAFTALTLFAVISFAALTGATQTIASIFHDQPALVAPIVRLESGAFYWPWSALNWSAHWRTFYPRPFALTDLILVSGIGAAMFAAAAAMGKGAPRYRGHGLNGWGGFEDARETGLFASTGSLASSMAKFSPSTVQAIKS